MSTLMEEKIKRWTAKRKTALVLEIIQGKTSLAEASQLHDLAPSEIESRVEYGRKEMESAREANPQEVREQYERQLRELQGAYGETMLQLRARKNCSPCWARTRSNREEPPGTADRRHHRLDQQIVSVVRGNMAHCVLPPGGLQANGSNRCLQWPRLLTNAGPPTCFESGPTVVMAGPRWPQ